MNTNDKEPETSAEVSGRVDLIVMRLRELVRYDVGDFNEGDGYMVSYQDTSTDGDWIRSEYIESLIKEFGA